MHQMLVRLVHIESVDVLIVQVHMAELKQLFVLLGWT